MTNKSEPTEFQLAIHLAPHLFYALDGENSRTRYFFPLRSLDTGLTLMAVDYDVVKNQTTNFNIKAVGQGCVPESPDDIVGFLFQSNLPVENYRTSLLAYSKAWQQSAPVIDVRPDEIVLALKSDHFLMYHTPGKATLVTSSNLSEALHDYLTMV